MNAEEERAWQRICELANVHPQAADLARYVSLAVRVDPPLLRRLRLDTQLLPASDASAEADLWFSDLSESRDGDGFVFDAQVAALLQQRLASERLADGRRALDVAYQHLETAHGDWPASLQVEERVTYLALRGGPAVDDEIAQALRPALVAMAESEQRGLEMARWVLRAMPRIPARARESDAAVALLVASITRIGAGADALAGTGSQGLPLDLGWLLRPSAWGSRTPLSFEVRTDAVVFREPGRATPEGLQISVPDTRPVVIELSWELAQGGGARLVAASPDVPVALPAGWRTLQLRTLTGEAYRLERTVSTPAAAVRKTCFVVQGYGRKTDYRDGRVLDLDASYAIIKDAAEEAGLECIRADEIPHSGTIDLPTYQWLLNADLVIADLSTYNVNAVFELGVRWALRPHSTIVVAEEQFQNPFDFSYFVIRRYKHLGDDISVKEARRFRDELKAEIAIRMSKDTIDSPVYTFLPDLVPPRIGAPEIPALASSSAPSRGAPRCLVVQGFGRKTDYRDGRVLDLDASYAIIQDAVEATGLECIRADEIRHSGAIDLPMYEWLLKADLVVADLSTYNVNAAFELGVRYALRPHATIVVAEEQFQNPFDVSHFAISRYKHLGEDIGRREAARFTAELKAAIAVKMADNRTDSPVYLFLRDLQPPRSPPVESDATTHPKGGDSSRYVHLPSMRGAPLPQHASWTTRQPWLAVMLEQQPDQVQPLPVELPLGPAAEPAAVLQLARAQIAGALQRRSGARRHAVKWLVAPAACEALDLPGPALQAGLDRLWDGMRRLPFSDMQLAQSMATWIALAAAGFAGAVGERERLAAERLFGPVLEVEFASDDGKASRGWVSHEQLRAACRDDLAEWLTDTAFAQARDVRPLLQICQAPERLFDFYRLLELFVEQIGPTQLNRAEPYFFHPARLEVLGLP